MMSPPPSQLMLLMQQLLQVPIPLGQSMLQRMLGTQLTPTPLDMPTTTRHLRRITMALDTQQLPGQQQDTPEAMAMMLTTGPIQGPTQPTPAMQLK